MRLIARTRSIVTVVTGAVALLLVVSSCTSNTMETTTTVPPTPELASTTTAAPSMSTTVPAPEPMSTTTTAPTTTTEIPTTVTSAPESTSTTLAAPTTTSTTVPVPDDNQPPTVEIISPGNLSSHTAVYDANTQRFGAAVSLSAVVSDPNDDSVTVQWISSDEGYLGTGESIIAVLHTGNYDSAQPRITARAIDQWNTASEATVQIIVWIPSDT